MAHLSASLHLGSEDIIKPGFGGQSRWIDLGNQLCIFASDAKLVELRDAIDAYLAQGFAKPEAA